MHALSRIRWGSATAAYQIEGATDRDGKVPNIWDEFTAQPGNVLHGDTGADACRTYENPQHMLDAISWLGVQTHRMSVAWSRVITADGTVNPDGLAYYRRILTDLRARNITPVVTLYHWDLPNWLQERGGWSALSTVEAFVAYVDVVVTELGDLVQDWITINEPFCAAFHGHLSGEHAPGLRDEAIALRTVLTQLHAHGEGVRAIRAIAPDARIGLAMNLSDLEPASDSAADVTAHRHADLVENRLFLDLVLRGRVPEDAAEYFGADVVAAAVDGVDVAGIAVPTDFIGINYYEHNVIRAVEIGTDLVVRGVEKLPVPEPRSANGVAFRPDGFRRVLLRVAGYAPELPIWVTENGIGLYDYRDPSGASNDPERVAFVDAYLDALGAAIDDGARIDAYYFWALMDNFEWAHGYRLRYGLFYTDFPTGELTPKASAHRYRARIEAALSERVPA